MDRPTKAPNATRARTALFAAALALPLNGPLQAGDAPTGQGNLILTGSTDGHYNGGEWPEWVTTVLSVLYLAIVSDDDDGTYYDEDHHRNHRHHCHGDYYDDCELGISVPKAQLGVGLSYFVSPDLALGGRYIYRRDFKDNEIETLWGGGPELTYYFGQPHDPIRPFLSGGLLYTRAIDRHTRERLEHGTSVSARGGVNIALDDSWGLVLQGGYQDDQLPANDGDPRVSKTLGFGIGFTASID